MFYTDTIIEYYEKSKKYGLGLLHGKDFTAVKLDYNMPYLNLVFGEYSEENFNQIKEFFAELPYCWFVNTNESHVSEMLIKNEFTTDVTDPVMRLILRDYNKNRTTNIIAKEVVGDDMLDIWAEVASKAYNLPKEGFIKFSMITAKEIRPDIKAFIGYTISGEPIATSLVNIGNQTAAIYWVGVLQEYRKQGIGNDMTKICIEYAKKLNTVKEICLQAFPDGIDLYQKIGFKVVDQVGHYWPSKKSK